MIPCIIVGFGVFLGFLCLLHERSMCRNASREFERYRDCLSRSDWDQARKIIEENYGNPHFVIALTRQYTEDLHVHD